MNDEKEIMYTAEMLTWLLFHVNPLIDKETTFDLVYDLLLDGLGKRSAKKYGQLIKKTESIRKDTLTTNKH